MDWYTFMSSVFEHITVPIIILIGGVIVAVLKPYAKKITSSVTMKNEMESLEKMTQAKSNLMDQIDKLVESAVGANMQLAKELKKNGRKLDEEDIAKLNESAKNLVIASLPIEVLDPEGDLYKLIGGDDKLDKMIMSLMEKHVYMFKLKEPQESPTTVSQTFTVPAQAEPEYSEEIGFVTPPEVLSPVVEEEPVSEEGEYNITIEGDASGASGTVEIPDSPYVPKAPARFGLG